MKRNRPEFAELRLSLVARLDKPLRRSRRALAQYRGSRLLGIGILMTN
jgi:hypothetical protein